MASLWSRFKATLGRWFRREPAPGRWLETSAFSLHGMIWFRPWLLPRRDFRLYLPRGFRRRKPAPVIALLHGCQQTAEEVAQGTRISALADAIGAVVVVPHQQDAANPHRCWNWFDRRTAAGKGEAAIVAAMIDKVARHYRTDPKRVIVAGLSSGAALAAVMGVRFPSLVCGVVTHSGIAAGAAYSAFTAVSVMARGPETDIAAIAQEARRDADRDAPSVPLLAIQGLDDDVVPSRHAAALVRQYLAFNGIDVPPGAVTTLPPADRTERVASTPRTTVTREWLRNGRPVARLVEVEGLAHTWSGGDPALPFNAEGPPDATAMIGDWLRAVSR